MLAAARFRANAVVVRGACPASDREDVAQELALAILERWPGYDPMRAAPATFASLVAACAAANLCKARRRRKRQGTPVALDEACDPALHTPPGQTAWSCARDVAQTVSRLEDRDQALCRGLAETPLTELARTQGLSRGAARRRVAHLRAAFEAAGLHAWLEAA